MIAYLKEALERTDNQHHKLSIVQEYLNAHVDRNSGLPDDIWEEISHHFPDTTRQDVLNMRSNPSVVAPEKVAIPLEHNIEYAFEAAMHAGVCVQCNLPFNWVTCGGAFVGVCTRCKLEYTARPTRVVTTYRSWDRDSEKMSDMSDLSEMSDIGQGGA